MKKVSKVPNQEKAPNAPKVSKGPGVGDIACKAILAGKDFTNTLAEVVKTHPKSGFSKFCYYWYRSHLRKGDIKKFADAKFPSKAPVKK